MPATPRPLQPVEKAKINRIIDIDARRAQRAEADSEPFTVVLTGESFTFPTVKQWPIEITDHLNSGDLAGAVRVLLAEDDWERFKACKPVMADVEDLFEALGANSGVGSLGE